MMIPVYVIAATAGAVTSMVAAPVVLSAMGFTSGGIAAGSIASSMMSSAAVANGGGIAAGSTVAVLQSAGAAGLTIVTKLAVASAGAAFGGVAGLVTKFIP